MSNLFCQKLAKSADDISLIHTKKASFTFLFISSSAFWIRQDIVGSSDLNKLRWSETKKGTSSPLRLSQILVAFIPCLRLEDFYPDDTALPTRNMSCMKTKGIAHAFLYQVKVRLEHQMNNESSASHLSTLILTSLNSICVAVGGRLSIEYSFLIESIVRKWRKSGKGQHDAKITTEKEEEDLRSLCRMVSSHINSLYSSQIRN